MGLEISQEKKEAEGITVNKALFEFLNSTKVDDLSGEQEIIYTRTETKICDILEVMKENNLHSLPVREELLDCDIGMISIMDILAYLHKLYVNNNKKDGFSKENINLFFNSSASRIMIQSLTDPLLSQTYHSNNQLCWVVSPDTSLLHVMKEISRDFETFKTIDEHPYVKRNEENNNNNNNNENAPKNLKPRVVSFSPYCKRVVLYSQESGYINNIISQSTILESLYNAIEFIQILLDEDSQFADDDHIASKLMVPSNKFIYIPEESKAIEAFDMLYQSGMRASPIVNQDKQVIGNLSISDSRCLQPSNVDNLFKSVVDYLKDMNVFKKPIAVYSNTNLIDIIRIMNDCKIHHIFVVENTLDSSENSDWNNFKIDVSSENVIGVLSLSDILRFLTIQKS